jgi:glucokinase
MVEGLTLVADVGGTNTRFALADANGIIAGSTARYVNCEVDSFVDAAQSYLSTVIGVKPTSLCAAIAGPVSGGSGKLTNGDWVFESGVLSRVLGMKRAHLLNDLAALGYALDVLPDDLVTQVGGGKPQGSQALVAGIATGFNISLCHAGHVMEAELGHASLPNSVMDVLQRVIGEKADGFRTVEALFSGGGISALHTSLGFDATDPAAITLQAGETVALFAEALGVFCREMTYQYMPLAGLYFNGSVARAILGSAIAGEIVSAESGKDKAFLGRFGQVPLYLITEDNAALYGCARYAQQQADAGA